MSTSLRKTVADGIKDLMWNHDNMSVTALAKKAGISRGQLHNILTENTDTKLDTIEAIAKVFRSEPSTLLAPLPGELGVLDDESTVLEGYDDMNAAVHVLCDALGSTDDEGKSTLLRVAMSLMGWVPNVEGIKLPRDWREMVYHYALDAGWVDVEPTRWEGLKGNFPTQD